MVIVKSNLIWLLYDYLQSQRSFYSRCQIPLDRILMAVRCDYLKTIKTQLKMINGTEIVFRYRSQSS
jgi:hypothetical protein